MILRSSKLLTTIILITFLSFNLKSCASLSHNENVEIFVPIISIGVIGGIGTLYIVRIVNSNNERRRVQAELEEQKELN